MWKLIYNVAAQKKCWIIFITFSDHLYLSCLTIMSSTMQPTPGDIVLQDLFMFNDITVSRILQLHTHDIHMTYITRQSEMANTSPVIGKVHPIKIENFDIFS